MTDLRPASAERPIIDPADRLIDAIDFIFRAAALEGASHVVNLVGAFDGKLDALMGEAPGTIGRIASANGVRALVHVSAIGADAASPTAYARAKALGESEEYTERMGLLTNAMADLNDREKAIFQARRLRDEPATLEELAQEYNVSRERIRQIEVRAFEKLQKAMRAAATERNLEAV